MTDPNANKPGYEYSCALDCWVPAVHGARSIQFTAAHTNTAPHLSELEREIQAKGLTAPRVTPQRIDEVIAGEYYFTAFDGVMAGANTEQAFETRFHASSHIPCLRLLTICVLVLKNGFTVTGESACASPENFDAAVGRKAARNNAVNKIWPLEGYLLRQQLHENLAKFRQQSDIGTASPGE